jgi:hypothetical protein
MDATLQMILALLMRWTHILSVIVLVGSAYYVRRTRSGFASEFRNTVYAAAGLAFLSGLYNFLTKDAYPPGYHMWFGIKFLLALHVLAALVLAAKRGGAGEKMERSLRITLLSATAAILISGYLRWLTQHTATVKLP